MKAIFGTIEFGYLCIGRDTSPIAIVHDVVKVVDVEDEAAADKLLDDAAESYIIVDTYKEEVVFSSKDAAIKWHHALFNS
jgi:hypothetical protein